MAAAPTLLAHAGFDVTLVTPRADMRRCHNVARLIMTAPDALLPTSIEEARRGDYALIVPGEDDTLLALRQSALPLADKLRLLPVTSERGLQHIASKIGLSQALAAGGVLTPAFRVAADPAALRDAAQALGYPVMVKGDFGAGGSQVARLDDDAAPAHKGLSYPALVQQVIEGDEVDCSAFFHGGELVAFSHATSIAKVHNAFGPSAARRYWTRPETDAALVEALGRLGRALDADGFANITTIRAHADGRYYFIEADMRPNAWIDYPKHFGADPAVAIAAAFGLPPVAPRPHATPVPEHLVMAYLPRLTLREILANRYDCRSHFDDYWQRGIVFDRLAKRAARFTPQRIVGKLRRMFGTAVIR